MHYSHIVPINHEEPVEDPEVPVVEDRFAIGLKSFDWPPPKARAVCYVCDAICERWRFDYRFQRSKSLKHERKVCAECVTPDLPDLDTNIRRLSAWHATANVPSERRMLGTVLERLHAPPLAPP